jgi:hypothetical protein
MVPRAVRRVHALGLAGLVVATFLAGCRADLGAVARDEGISADAIVRLDDTFAVAAQRAGSRVEVVALLRTADDEWETQVIASGRTDEVSAHLVSAGGDTGDEWNSYLFGTAPASASRVVVAEFASSGGQVTDGAWVLAFREKDLHPDQLSWSVLDATGAILHSGSGITP